MGLFVIVMFKVFFRLQFITHSVVLKSIRDLRYISIWQYIDTLIEYRIVMLCSINIEISKCLIVHILCC